MDNFSDRPTRRRRKAVFGGSVADSTDGIGTSFDEPEEDLADSAVDINKLAEQRHTSMEKEAESADGIDVYDKETRLRYIHKMKMRDTPKKTMCERLGITQRQLEKDIKELYSRLREGARKLDINELIGDSIATYNEVLSMALNHASNRRLPTPTRLAALRTVLSAKNDLHRFLNIAGVYDVAIYKQKESKAETDIGQLMKVTQAILDKDEGSDTHEISTQQRIEVEKEMHEIRLF